MPGRSAWRTSYHSSPCCKLRASDFPEMPFPPGADLFQMLWCPREHGDIPECRERPSPMFWADPRFCWRNRRQVARPRPDNPAPQEAYYEYVPFPCRLMPERVTEFPSDYDLPGDVGLRISEWEVENSGPDEYAAELSVACGTKVGGYINWIQSPWQPACECGRPMEHLLTIASVEWNGVGDHRWTPAEEQATFASFPGIWDQWHEEHKAVYRALWNPTGLSLGDAGQMQLFICRHCGRWPIVPGIEC